MNRYNKYILVHMVAGIKSLRVWAGLTAIFMTLLMFTLMPALLKPVENHPVRKRYIIHNKEIFILQPETPEEFKEPEPLKPLSKRPHILVSAASVKGPKPKTHMAFEMGPGLTGSSDFILPAPGAISVLELGLPNIFNAGDLDHPLVSVKRMPPVYPVRAKQEKIQGYVTIQFIVNTRGGVEDVTVIESNPSGVFDQSVITCVYKWLFKPGAVNGEVVNTLAQTTVNFELEQN
ncbi:MAG: TonB family protein [Deltaproteobacteria bacterium]|nr:TonB family protein [Deltaproteobacteria bacterium]